MKKILTLIGLAALGVSTYAQLPGKVDYASRQGAGVTSLTEKTGTPHRSGSAKASLAEGFENSPLYGVPAGWSLRSEPIEGQAPSPQYEWWAADRRVDDLYYIKPSEGNVCIVANPSEDPKYIIDEWLISPKFNLKEGQNLSFYAYIFPLNFYQFDANTVDFSKIEWKKKVQVGTVQVLVREDGSHDWVVVLDFAEYYKDAKMQDCLHPSDEMLCYHVDISKYSGKDIQLAFRNYGAGNEQYRSIAIDDVLVDVERMNLSYREPKGTLYYGTIEQPMIQTLDETVAVLPVYAPLTWHNTSERMVGDEFDWDYDTNATKVSEDADGITLTFKPDYTSEQTIRNNELQRVTLNGYRGGDFAGSFSGISDWIQGGGHPAMNIRGDEYVFGLLPFDVIYSELSATFVNSMEYGEEWVPVLGFYNIRGNERSAQYNTLRYFGNDFVSTDWVSLNAFGNVIESPASPLVMTKAWVHGRGYILNGAQMTLTVYGMDKDFNKVRPVARGQFNYDGMQEYYNLDDWNYCSLPFEFATPAVLDGSFPYYFLEVSGYNDPQRVQYFAPSETKFTTPNSFCPGRVEAEIYHDGDIKRELWSLNDFKDVAETNHDNRAFYITMDAYYPWMHSDIYSLVAPRGERSTLKLDSYYDGCDVNIEVTGAPEGHALPTATLTGRYANAEFSVEVPTCDCASYHYYKAHLTAPGVDRWITFSDDPASVSVLDAEGGEVEGIYTLQGYRIQSHDLEPGSVYIVKYKGGKTAKIVAK